MTHRVSTHLTWLTALVWCIPAANSHGQEPVAPELDNHAFRLVLHQSGLQPLYALDDLWDGPERNILIVFGDATVISRMPNGVRDFVEAGGAALIATDRQTGCILGGRFRTLLCFSVAQIRARRGSPSYGDSEECPLVTNAKPASVFETNLPVATNRPTSINGNSVFRLPTLAYLADSVSQQNIGWGHEPRRTFSRGGDLGKGRLLVIADHSIFVNGMMLPRELENGNMQLAYNCVRWLQEGKRDRVLFIDEGRIVTDFDVPVRTMPDIPLSPVQVANVAIAAIEKENLLNRFLLEWLGRRRVLRTALITITALLMAYGLFRLMRGGFQYEARLPSVAGALAKLAPADGVHFRDNAGEAGRALARETLADVGFLEGSNAGRTKVRLAGNWWERRRLAAQVRRLRGIAFGREGAELSLRRLRRITHDAAAVKLAAQNGRLTIDSVGE